MSRASNPSQPSIDAAARAQSELDRGVALARGGDLASALAAFRAASELAPQDVAAWMNLGLAHEQLGDAAAALAAFTRVLDVDADNLRARILRADAGMTLGRLDAAQADLRAALRRDPDSIEAWSALLQLAPEAASEAELERLLSQRRRADLSGTRRIRLGFACARALEAQGRYAQACELYHEANAAKRGEVQWNAPAASALVDAILAAFAPAAPPEHSQRGAGLIFVVGMPRSGSTLVEQILSAHPRVRGAGETNAVSELLQQESQRRNRRFPHWVREADAADWHRLGEAFLQRIGVSPGASTRVVDKTLSNWQTLGAIRRMLPAARVVHCRRDALETCWSAYTQNFAQGQFFSYDLAELVAFWRDAERALQAWQQQHPGWIVTHRHEALLADPEAGIRALLDACALDFDPACLRFHETQREVRTASVAQVRQPLRRDRARARAYGELLDPLRRLLEHAAPAGTPHD